MKISETKAELEFSLGSVLTEVKDGTLDLSVGAGRFWCAIENFDHFTVLHRNFESEVDSLTIPFSCQESTIEMIFSLDGQSAFRNRSDPFLLAPVSHCINLSNPYECQTLLDKNSHQHDIVIRLRKEFYTDLIASHLSSSEDRLPAMILQQKTFNTINEHIRADAGVLGLLKNILDCPFTGNMRAVFVREHVRALLTLQLMHFSPIVTRQEITHDGKITKRDEEVLHEVKKYLDGNFLDAASLDMLTRRFGINDFKLKHGFKSLFNTSPMRYLQYKRLEYSLFLLRETDKPIKTIASEIGYSHSANFTAAFSKTFGNPPQHFRSSVEVRA